MEKAFIIAMCVAVLIGALYAAVNTVPNKHLSTDSLLSSYFWCFLAVALGLIGAAMVIASFHQSVLKGFIAMLCPAIGYCIAWYLIKIPERKYQKGQKK